MKGPLKIYMADLTHDTVVLVSDTIPINIGFIGAYARKIHGDNVDISLFKYPASILKAIQEYPPDVVALSNYSWNSFLAERVAAYAKEHNPQVVTVQGGTNFPHEAPLQRDFLLQRPNTDIYLELEAEQSFAELIARLLAARDGGPKIFDSPYLSGGVFIVPESRRSANPQLAAGPKPDRFKILDDIPSPYLSGMMDHFFDGKLTPFLETNRGCPFTCTFCHTGNGYFNKVNQFSLERVAAEIEYIAPRMKELGIVNLHIADTNFAMYPRDKTICEMLLKTQKDFGWPLQIMSTTGKNNKERVIEITQIMGNTFSVNMSVQSMDSEVLKNIRRENIKLDHYVAVNKSLSESGRSTKGELIIGLPGETRETFVRGMQNVINAGVSSVCTYSLMMLHGTPFKEPQYRAQFQMQGKYRIVPLDFGEYEGRRVFDIEETGIANKDMSFDDYLWIRGLSLMVEVMHNSRPFHELFKYVSVWGMPLFDFILRVYNGLETAPAKVREIVDGFLAETRGELWDSEEELIAHYTKDENYERLRKGEVGGNLIYKYKAISLAFGCDAWIEFLSDQCKAIALENLQTADARETALRDIDVLAEFVRNKLAGVLNISADLAPRLMRTPCDILGWQKTPLATPLSDFALTSPIVYQFEYTDEQLRTRLDQFKRYGSHANGLSKICTRVSNVESLFRKIRSFGETRAADEAPQVDQFIRYTLSN